MKIPPGLTPLKDVDLSALKAFNDFCRFPTVAERDYKSRPCGNRPTLDDGYCKAHQVKP